MQQPWYLASIQHYWTFNILQFKKKKDTAEGVYLLYQVYLEVLLYLEADQEGSIHKALVDNTVSRKIITSLKILTRHNV